MIDDVFSLQCLGRWRPLWENIWINDTDRWRTVSNTLRLTWAAKKKTSLTDRDAALSQTLLSQHQTATLALQIAKTVQGVLLIKPSGNNKKKKSTGGTFLCPRPLSDQIRHRPNESGVVGRSGRTQLGTRNCLLCEPALLCARSPSAWLGDTCSGSFSSPESEK